MTILKIKDEEIAVIEMGMNHPGEISYLSKIAKPDIAVITNIGTSHIGNLGSRENILKAKLEILDGMNKKRIVINNDNDLLHKWKIENKGDIEIHTFGIYNDSEAKAEDVSLKADSSDFICRYNDEEIKIEKTKIENQILELYLTGKYNLLEISDELSLDLNYVRYIKKKHFGNKRVPDIKALLKLIKQGYSDEQIYEMSKGTNIILNAEILKYAHEEFDNTPKIK